MEITVKPVKEMAVKRAGLSRPPAFLVMIIAGAVRCGDLWLPAGSRAGSTHAATSVISMPPAGHCAAIADSHNEGGGQLARSGRAIGINAVDYAAKFGIINSIDAARRPTLCQMLPWVCL
jgi:hypothetical protein